MKNLKKLFLISTLLTLSCAGFVFGMNNNNDDNDDINSPLEVIGHNTETTTNQTTQQNPQVNPVENDDVDVPNSTTNQLTTNNAATTTLHSNSTPTTTLQLQSSPPLVINTPNNNSSSSSMTAQPEPQILTLSGDILIQHFMQSSSSVSSSSSSSSTTTTNNQLETTQQNNKKRKRSCFGLCSSDSDDEIKIRLKKNKKCFFFTKFIPLKKSATKKETTYFNNKAFDLMAAGRDIGLIFEYFSDEVVQLVLSLINKQLDFDQTKQALIYSLENNQNINAEEVYFFADYLGYEKILQILTPILAEHYCSPEFFNQYTEGYFDVFPGKENLINAIGMFLHFHRCKTKYSFERFPNPKAYSPNRQYCAYCFNNKIYIYTVASGYHKHLIGHSDRIRSVTFSPNGQLLASGSRDYTAKIWNVDSSQCILTLTGHANNIESVAFSPDGQLLATGSLDKTIKIWDVKSGQLKNTLYISNGVVSVAFSPSGQFIAANSMNNTKICNVNSGQCILTLTEHIPSAAFSPDEQLLATGSWDKTIKIWNIKSGQRIYTLIGHDDEITSVAFNKKGLLTAISRNSWSRILDGTVKIWDLNWFKKFSIEQLILIIKLQNCKNITLNRVWSEVFKTLTQEDKIDAGINDVQVSFSTHMK